MMTIFCLTALVIFFLLIQFCKHFKVAWIVFNLVPEGSINLSNLESVREILSLNRIIKSRGEKNVYD